MEVEKDTSLRVKTADSDSTEVDPALDRAITRKFDLHVVPWLFGLWLLAFVDRSNIGLAKIDGLTTDLKLGGTSFNTVRLTELRSLMFLLRIHRLIMSG